MQCRSDRAASLATARPTFKHGQAASTQGKTDVRYAVVGLNRRGECVRNGWPKQVRADKPTKCPRRRELGHVFWTYFEACERQQRSAAV